MEWRTDEEAGDLFYSTYAEACRERDQVPLPASFVRGERSRNPQSCSFALVHRGDELAGHMDDGPGQRVLKVVEEHPSIGIGMPRSLLGWFPGS